MLGTSNSLLPNMSDSDAMNGCTTAEVSRYDVPAQNASVADPCRSLARVGKTVTRMVASRATVREETAKVIMTSHSFFPGFQFLSAS